MNRSIAWIICALIAGSICGILISKHFSIASHEINSTYTPVGEKDKSGQSSPCVVTVSSSFPQSPSQPPQKQSPGNRLPASVKDPSGQLPGSDLAGPNDSPSPSFWAACPPSDWKISLMNLGHKNPPCDYSFDEMPLIIHNLDRINALVDDISLPIPSRFQLAQAMAVLPGAITVYRKFSSFQINPHDEQKIIPSAIHGLKIRYQIAISVNPFLALDEVKSAIRLLSNGVEKNSIIDKFKGYGWNISREVINDALTKSDSY